jgi:hypothetical protein
MHSKYLKHLRRKSVSKFSTPLPFPKENILVVTKDVAVFTTKKFIMEFLLATLP